jgi:hypothetical protein
LAREKRARERGVGRELLPKTSAELDEQQHRDGAERREQRHVGVMQQLLPGREHRGDDDCRPHRAAHGRRRDLVRVPADPPSPDGTGRTVPTTTWHASTSSGSKGE